MRGAARERDGHDPLDEATELDLKHRGLHGSRLVLADRSGFALLRGDELSLVVHPGRRGDGIGTALAAALAPAAASAWSHGDHPAARRLAQRHDLEPVRELWVMRRPLSEPLPPTPSRPGITVRSFREDDAEAVLAVNGAAFADHPEQGAMDRANLAERMSEPWFDPEGLLLAVDDEDRLLGFHWTKRHDARHGEVYVVGIDPDAQGRGLGSLLTLAGLHHLDDGRTREVLLYVEADNLPARAVYEKLGFTHAATDTHVRFARA